MNSYYNPVHTIQGAGSLKHLPELVQKAAPDGSLLILLRDESLRENETVKALSEEWEGRIQTECFPYSNPHIGQLFDLYQRTKERNTGLVVAIGGGSVLDAGKSLCCLYDAEIDSPQELRFFIAEKKYGKPSCPWIGVPTTAGTGSEVTCWATVWDPEQNRKFSVDTAENYAFAAIIDPELLYSMPLSLAVSSAIDAAAHAAESYWARAGNPVSRSLALEAIRLIMTHVDELLADPQNSNAHDGMSRGSLLAGLAFSNTRTTACHSISYPLTMGYDMPHGAAVGLLLAPVLKLNLEYIPEPKPLLDAFGVSKAEDLGSRIGSIFSCVGIPPALHDWGITREALPDLAAHSITKGRADNNPAKLTEALVIQLLQTIL